MTSFIQKAMIFTTLAFLAAACAPATQNIPVSSVPAGAQVLADGTEICTTPCNVPLTRTQAHILTLQKQGYRQADVQIKQVYDTAAVAQGAVRAGSNASSNGGNADAAISNALLNTQAMEDQGTAYVLSPSSVVVQLQPDTPAKTVAQTSSEEQPIVISSDQLDASDRERLENGQAPVVISSDQLAPQDQQANIRTTEPATLGGAVQQDPMKAAEAVLEAGAAAAPTVGTQKKWKNSHSSENFGNDGSYTKKTSSSSVSVGASVNPAEAGLGLLHLIEDANKDNGQQTAEESQ
ncbi:PEGA domain-containing protein [uncultured Pseudodesulfovibrio sp.]|uniref:PEGA domain-containing protein n=1 Tax=uncultured Pseudodesulfovibrio sp. TaxID=2035858 RepID=UPI0029C81B12|nr:PEGA domain-containing protein [uncultured Pseudodesulfovibrio sp.]